MGAAAAAIHAEPAAYPRSRLNPAPDDYAAASFADKATLTMHAGAGGHGCISFLRDLFLPDGPPNGGDGGHGGNVYIQAVPGETSLHKIARRRVMRAGRGKHGQGSARNGQRGDDVIISVPVGTVVTEVSRIDPVADDAVLARERYYARKRRRQQARAAEEGTQPEENPEYKSGEQRRRELAQKQEDEAAEDEAERAWLRRKWVLYPALSASEAKSVELPAVPRRDRFFMQPPAPIYLDLSRPTPQPILLAAGGVGGLGNPHFVSRKTPRPVFATKGDSAVSLTVALELKLLADVGLVGLPNAGKSTLLRAVSNSRTRVGAWAFTTLQPNIGTVVLDSNRGRPLVNLRRPSAAGDDSAEDSSPLARFTIADIPGLIEGAHLDKGLGIEFLRHVERAGVLAFVVDLGAGNAVDALKALWKEVGLYARMRADEEQQRELEARIEWDGAEAGPAGTAERAPTTVYTEADAYGAAPEGQAVSPELAIAGKPWFVVATKGDLPGAEANFAHLKAYLDRVGRGEEEHPSGVAGGWTEKLAAMPISAINGHGVDRVIHWTVGLLDL